MDLFLLSLPSFIPSFLPSLIHSSITLFIYCFLRVCCHIFLLNFCHPSAFIGFLLCHIRGAESSLPVAQPGYQVLSDILFRLGLIANALTQCSSYKTVAT